jgi:hypothetical protein
MEPEQGKGGHVYVCPSLQNESVKMPKVVSRSAVSSSTDGMSINGSTGRLSHISYISTTHRILHGRFTRLLYVPLLNHQALPLYHAFRLHLRRVHREYHSADVCSCR